MTSLLVFTFLFQFCDLFFFLHVVCEANKINLTIYYYASGLGTGHIGCSFSWFSSVVQSALLLKRHYGKMFLKMVFIPWRDESISGGISGEASSTNLFLQRSKLVNFCTRRTARD